MRILINKDGIDKTIFMQKWFNETITLNGQVIDVEDTYNNCVFEDFDFTDGKFVFNLEKYNNRIETLQTEEQQEIKLKRISNIQLRLNQLSQDLIQAQAGAVFEDLEERKNEFQALHNELRVLLGKTPRIYTEVSK